MDERNFFFMFLGFACAWAIVAAYVAYLGTREGKLKKQLESLKRMIEDREKPS